MPISLPILNAINVQELEMLQSILGIRFLSKTQELELHGHFSTKQLISIYFELKNSIWNRKNVQLVTQELEQEQPNRTRIHYFGSGRPQALDGYISKMGLLEHDILVEDPLCFPLIINPDYEDHLLKNPQAHVKHVFENALMMICLEDWIRKGYVYFVPSLPMIDFNAYREIGERNKTLADEVDFSNLPSVAKSIKYSIEEGRIAMMLEASRLRQNHYTVEHIKRDFPHLTDEKAQFMLDAMKSQSLEEREITIISKVLEKTSLTELEKLSLLSQFERTRPFNIERYLDVSKIDQGLIQTHSMPLLQATYLAERFNCIPSTDNIGLMYGYEGWCQALGQTQGIDFEKVRTKVDLPFNFLDKLPLSFVEYSRESGKGRIASIYLDQQWSIIRQTQDLKSYAKAAADYSAKVSSDFDELEVQHEQMIDDLVLGFDRSALAGLGAFIAFELTTHLPLAVIGGITAALGSTLGTLNSFNKNKGELKAKPLAVFLDAKKIVKK